ncbi:amino acid permease [Pseudobacillus wudalianchiensis]|uniref:Gamma-aminobutyrate permease n=1 Tax=Pseudobacillus wudalianchiensis TaxID=1743143 RepID=A0A1B9BA34_9BACI|nr:amino acid permease [Bacillus wudalianchiensis]OCA92931.1 gamma-aminobutyrate permease [Bacillus wudalianchiensis]
MSNLEVKPTIEEHAASPAGKLERGLRSRHISMIAIGGAIGTGLFVASGATISQAGPGGAFIAYLAIGCMVYFLMTSLGEMATYLPVSGSFETYGTRFVDPAFGFTLGWNYWLSWATTIPAELAAGALVMKYWLPGSSDLLWGGIFLTLIFLLNVLSVKGYGEAEFWFAGIKVITIAVFLIVGVAIIFGIFTGPAVGFENFTKGEAPFKGGFLAIIGIFMIAGFSFQGTEMVGIASGESENPEKNVPRAIRTVFWRVLIFYVFSILVIGLIIPYTDPSLLKSDVDNIMISPFTLVFQKAGLAFAASLMNAVILTSVLSAGNSATYASTRMLWALAQSGKAPKLLRKINSKGVPIYALYANILFGLIVFLSSFVGDGVVYLWLLNMTGLTGFLTWVGIAICHYRFRKAYVAQGRDLNELKFKAKWYPFGPLLTLVLCTIVIIGQGSDIISGDTINWYGLLVSYISLPVFIILWLGYKIIKKTKVVPLKECDFNRDNV